MDDSPEALDAMWAQLANDELKARLEAANAKGIDGIQALIGELTLDAGMAVGEAHYALTLVELLSAKIGDDWGTANARAMTDVLQSWSDKNFDLVGEDYPRTSGN